MPFSIHLLWLSKLPMSLQAGWRWDFWGHRLVIKAFGLEQWGRFAHQKESTGESQQPLAKEFFHRSSAASETAVYLDIQRIMGRMTHFHYSESSWAHFASFPETASSHLTALGKYVSGPPQPSKIQRRSSNLGAAAESLMFLVCMWCTSQGCWAVEMATENTQNTDLLCLYRFQMISAAHKLLGYLDCTSL